MGFAKYFILFFVVILLAGSGIFRTARAADLPFGAAAVLSKAHELAKEEKFNQALEILEKFKARSEADGPAPDLEDPRGYHHAEIYFMTGYIHYQKGEPDAAEHAYDQALIADPDHIDALVSLGRVCYEQEKYSKAADSFYAAYSKGGRQEPSYLYYAAVSYLTGDFTDKSVKCFRQLADLHPDKIQPLWRENLVHAYLSANLGKEALSHIKILADIYEGDKKIQWQEILLHQYLELGMYYQARDYILELTSRAPLVAKWWKAMAHVALETDDQDKAVSAMTIYSYLSPLSTREKKLLGDLYLQAEIPVKAIEAYENIDGGNVDKEVLRNLVIALQQAAKQEKAVKVLEDFEKIERDPELMMLKADLLYQMEKYEAAADSYKSAARIGGGHSGRAWLMAGYAAWGAEDLKTAENAFKRAVQFDDHKKEAESALKKIKAIN
jgi:tetratricopeptide (TPR) repeat protein